MFINTSYKPSVFLSHSSKDKPFVRVLAEQLRRSDIFVWLDEAELFPGDTLNSKIVQGITGIDFLVVVLSPASCTSEWVNYEVRLAINGDLGENKVEVIPIIKEDCEIPEFLRDKIWADLSKQDTYATEILKIVTKIRRNAQDKLERSIILASGIVITCNSRRSIFFARPRVAIDGVEYILSWNTPKFIQLRPNEVHKLDIYFRATGIPGTGLSRTSTEVVVNYGEKKSYVYKPALNTLQRGTLIRLDY